MRAAAVPRQPDADLQPAFRSCLAQEPELVERTQAAAQHARHDPSAFPEATRAAIRDVLRVGGYRPSGSGKPASEFLHGAARDHDVPVVNNLVDINNLCVALDRTADFHVRCRQAGHARGRALRTPR